MRSARALVVGVAAAALLLTGCEDAQQRNARQELQAYLRSLPNDGGYRVDATQCMSSPRLGYVNVVPIAQFVCAGHRTDGLCDEFTVTLRKHGAARVVLRQGDSGCVLPQG
jgi:hypothetical protein